MTISADLKRLATRIFKGGGELWLVEYDISKVLLTPHATVKNDYAAEVTSIEVHKALIADWGTSGTLQLNVCDAGSVFTELYNGLSANVFDLVNTLDQAISKGCRVRKSIANLYVESTFKHAGHLAEEGTRISDAVESEDVHNEAGDQVQTLFGKETFGVVTNLLQTSKEELEFLLSECRDKYYAARYVVPIRNQGNQFWLFPKVQIVPMTETTFGNVKRMLPVTIKVLLDSVSGKTWELWEG